MQKITKTKINAFKRGENGHFSLDIGILGIVASVS